MAEEQDCRRCGRCCISAFITLGGIAFDQDRLELGKWLAHHRCDVAPMETPAGRFVGVRIPLVCRNLEYLPNSTHTKCAIYEERPVVCKEYHCDYMTGEVASDGDASQ